LLSLDHEEFAAELTEANGSNVLPRVWCGRPRRAVAEGAVVVDEVPKPSRDRDREMLSRRARETHEHIPRRLIAGSSPLEKHGRYGVSVGTTPTDCKTTTAIAPRTSIPATPSVRPRSEARPSRSAATAPAAVRSANQITANAKATCGLSVAIE
jgi:hypothetical protein